MKVILENRLLSTAFAVSLLAHGVLLAVRFVPPDAFKFKPADPGLEVILVNAKHDRAPLKAEALAQANLDGGGNAEKGRSKSPLPDMRRNVDGDSVKTLQRRVEELEQQQRMLAQLSKAATNAVASSAEPLKSRENVPRPTGADTEDSARQIARMAAEIAKRIEDENKRPKKTHISPSTRAVGYATYYNNVRERIEKFGTLNYPQQNGKKLYGELILSISIFQDGSIYEKDPNQGISVERSSGNKALDDAARRIVSRAAPFGSFPKNMRSQGKDDVWVMTTRFKFTREHGVEAVMHGGPG